MPAESVIAVVGISFCGSSVLNLVLGSHSEIHGGGELHKLFLPERCPRCSVCQYECSRWTETSLAAAPKSGLYHYLANLFQRKIIVDSAKTIVHFREITPLNDDLPHYFVSMKKHPIRHVTSYLVNKFFVDQKLIHAVNDGSAYREHFSEMVEFVRERCRRLSSESLEVEQFLRQYAKRHQVLDVRYEELIQQPVEVLTTILKGVGLKYQPGICEFTRFEHHPIGGNRGPHYQISRKLSTSRFVEFRKKYYEENSGLAMDNKFRDALVDSQIETIVRMPEYLNLCAQLGYDPLDFDLISGPRAASA